MARLNRLTIKGFYHLINRGVAKKNIFKYSNDKEKFLEILCKACNLHKAKLHSYCLMINHYHLLIETTKENLSILMRQINSNFAMYYNKKHERSGHLWQGRFKSYYIENEIYLNRLLRYIEFNPIVINITKKIGEYKYTLFSTLINKKLKIIPCAYNSILINKTIDFFVPFHQNELNELRVEEHKKIISVKNSYNEEKNIKLEEYFKNTITLNQRNITILCAIENGYKQSEIARFLKMSSSAISKIYRSK